MDGVRVSMLASSAIDRGSTSSWVKPNTIKLVFVASPLIACNIKEKEQRQVGTELG